MKTKTLQEQIDIFYEETGYQLEVKDGKPYYDGYLQLKSTHITKLPDNLVVGGYLNIRHTNITKLPNNLIVGGSLYIQYSKVTELPENLIVGDSLDLRDTKVTKLPDNLVVGGNLYLDYTHITELPNNFVVGGNLYLKDSKIAKLPDNVVVGGNLDLEGSKITKLPDNLVVGASLDLGRTLITELPNNLAVGRSIWDVSSTLITPTLTKEAREKGQKIRNFLQWKQGNKTYIKADGIFSVVDNHRGNVWRTHCICRDKALYVVTDGEGHYAHGNTLKEAKADLIYKINDRDTSLYEMLSLDDEVSFEDAIAMYRTITGACSAGTKDFIESRLPKPHKDKYTIMEIIDLTDGEYGSETFKNFFDKKQCVELIEKELTNLKAENDTEGSNRENQEGHKGKVATIESRN